MPLEPGLSNDGPHDEAEELLPWYATGQLEASDRARVERHLYSCAACREQLTVERRLVTEFHATSPQVESGWARLKARIDPPRATFSPSRSMFAELWSLLTRPAVATLAIAQLAFAVVAATVLLSLSRPDYHALGSQPAPSAANMIVMFRPEARQESVREALKGIDASIVGGPTAAGAYLLHVDPVRRQYALARLRSDDDVQLAQPLDGAVQ